ncbi:hypothetical protein COBT_001495 [Conglomerata obtusa]
MNDNPEIFATSDVPKANLQFKQGRIIEVTKNTVFELIRNIVDPEHPQTLEQLRIITLDSVKVYENEHRDLFIGHTLPVKIIEVKYRPTIPHCSMAAVIGLAIKMQLLKYVSLNIHIKVMIETDGHVQEKELNKQINDKDRVFAAGENESVMHFLKPLLPIFDVDDE